MFGLYRFQVRKLVSHLLREQPVKKTVLEKAAGQN